ncbi:hypothetical protein CRG98_027902 [Punica granatum]|uniref:Uncharacterized protein n=1 Tax=Punica granatum TaxID=22663 RepID=A0A2I0J672_PUNGR|nr:hypothetical protein CRG98_027902 [Punica granatum]
MEDHGDAANSSIFTLFADNFLASRITFKGCNINFMKLICDGEERCKEREMTSDTKAIIFEGRSLNGNRLTYLRRAYRAYSTMRNLFTFVESNCSGPGTNVSGRVRVSWTKTFGPEEPENYLKYLCKFIDKDVWIEAQLPHN